MSGVAISELEFGLLTRYLRTTCGLDVPWKKRYLFETRLSPLLGELGCRTFSQLYQALTSEEDPKVKAQLIEAMTTNETGFFRDRHPFEALGKQILPALAKRKCAAEHSLSRRLRLASIGCSTGEEPYSVAMVLDEWLKNGGNDFPTKDVSLLALDISRPVLDQARRGWYPRDRVLRTVPKTYLDEYFETANSGYSVNPSLRRLVSFAEVNLNASIEHFGYFDVIFCRNVIIYFSPELRRRVLESFARMLNQGGVLILGASESLFQLTEAFRSVHLGPTIYYEKQ